jgi:hypothetical protein
MARRAILSRRRAMAIIAAWNYAKTKLREHLRSTQARYDELTRLLEERIERGEQAQARREAS